MTCKLLYVAGPYAGDIEYNIKRAEDVSIGLIRNGFHVLTPHKNTSGYEQYEDDEITVQTWIDMDLDMLLRCDALYVMADYENSMGTLNEIAFAKFHGIPVFYAYDYPFNSLTIDDYYEVLK